MTEKAKAYDKVLKAYTDIEQSKKLAEILPHESADMHYIKHSFENFYNPIPFIGKYSKIHDEIPCWSFSALFNIFDWPKLSTSSLGDGTIGIMISVYPNGYRHDSGWYDNPIDACVEMVLKLHELNLL